MIRQLLANPPSPQPTPLAPAIITRPPSPFSQPPTSPPAPNPNPGGAADDANLKVNPFSLRVGDVLTERIQPGGMAGENVVYTITPQPLPENFEFERRTGLLRFTPAPDQVGVYEFKVTASDGSRSAAEKVRIRAQSPNQSAASVSGRIIDESGQPLKQVRVQIGESVGFTNAQGRFTVRDVSDDPPPLVIDGGPNRLKPMAPVTHLLGHSLYERADNRVADDLVLPVIDMANAVDFADIDPDQAVEIVSPAMPGVTLRIEAGSARTSDGAPYRGKIALSALPASQMQPFLPEGLSMRTMIGVDGDGLRFSTPAKITMPNMLEAEPGFEVGLLTMNPQTGGFDVTGTLRVSEDGERLETVSGGILNSSCLALDMLAPWYGSVDVICSGCEPTASADGGKIYNPSNAGLVTGSTYAGSDLPETYSKSISGVEPGLNSQQADPKPVVVVRTKVQIVSYVPQSISAQTFTGGVSQGSAVTFTPPSGMSGGSEYLVPTQIDAGGIASGPQLFKTTITHNYSGGISRSRDFEGYVNVVNESASPYGAGVSMEGVQRIHAPSSTSPVLITAGTQGTEFYTYKASGDIRDVALVSPNFFFGSTIKRVSNDGDGTLTVPSSGASLFAFSITESASGDLNGDGRADLALIAGSSLIVALANTSGGFQSPSTISLPSSALAIAIGNFDNSSNGRLDAALLRSDGQLAILPGNGDGTFGTAVVSSIAGSFSLAGLKEGDLDGDGDLDLAAVTKNSSGNDLRVLIHSSGGSFSASSTISLSASSSEVAVKSDGGDIDGDGDLDLVALAGDKLYIYVNGGTANFTAGGVEGLPYNTWGYADLAVGNFYGGGLAAASWTRESGLRIVPITSSGAWGNRQFYTDNNVASGFTTAAATVLASDLNGDGKSDIVLADGGDTIKVYFTDPVSNNLRPAQTYSAGAGGGTGAVTIAAVGKFGGNTVAARYIGPPSDPSVLARNSGGTWTRTYPDGTVLQFDANGRQTSIADRNGNATTFAYVSSGAAAGALSAITDPSNLVTTFSYDSNGHLRTVVDSANRTTTFSIDAAHGNLTSVTTPDGAVTQYGYSTPSNHRPTAITDSRGSVTTIQYDSFGLFSSMTLPGGDVFSVQSAHARGLAAGGGTLMTPGDFQASVTDPNGHTTTYSFDSMGHVAKVIDPLSRVTTITHESHGWVKTVTDPLNRTTTYSYDSKGNATRVDRPDGSNMTVEYDPTYSVPTKITDFRGKVTTFTLDSHGNVTRQTDPDLDHGDFTYNSSGQILTATDRNGNATTFAYDNVGRLTTIAFPGSGSPTVSAGYDAAGNLTRVTDELGHAVTLTYDAMGRPLTSQNPIQAAANVRSQAAYDPNGNLASVTDALGRVTTFTYDGRDRLTSVIEPIGARTTFVYDGVNRIRAIDPLNRGVTYAYDAADQLTSVTDPLGNRTTFTYDNAGQNTQVTDANNHTTTFAYDVLGRLRSQTLPGQLPGPSGSPVPVTTTYTYDNNSNVTNVEDAMGNSTSFGYDDLNRQTSMSRVLNWFQSLTTTFVYDDNGNRTRIIDPLGHATTFVYDQRNRVTRQEQPSGGGIVTFTYDLASRLTSVTDPVGNVTSYSYDNANRRTQEIDPRGKTTTFVYDVENNLTRKIDRLGRVREFTYDANDRLTQEDWKPSVGASSVRSIPYSYDAAGQLTSVSDPDSLLTFTYDQAGRMDSAATSSSAGQPNVTLTMGYDGVGNRASMVDNLPSVGRTTYMYDAANRLTTMTRSTGGTAGPQVLFAYDAANRLQSMSRSINGSGTTIDTSYAYDNADRLTTMSHQIVGGSTLASYAFAYDDASRITSETDASGTASYTYDDFGQLTGVSGARSESYSYDQNGNRTMSGYGSATGNRLTAGAGYSYNYDDEGNMISKTETATGQVTSLTYDYRNRLTQVARRSSSGAVLAESSYTYDALDRRIRVTSDADGAGSNPAVTTWTVYDGVNPYADFNGSGQLSERYLYALAVDALLARTDGSNDTDWYLTDRLGSVREVVDASTGSVEYSARYDSYGNVISASGTADRFGYTAREWDGAARLQFNRARYYDPAVGRWVNEDFYSFAGGDANLYRFVINSPLNFIDPSGHFPLGPIIVILLGGGALCASGCGSQTPPGPAVVHIIHSSEDPDLPDWYDANILVDRLNARMTANKLNGDIKFKCWKTNRTREQYENIYPLGWQWVKDHWEYSLFLNFRTGKPHSVPETTVNNQTTINIAPLNAYPNFQGSEQAFLENLVIHGGLYHGVLGLKDTFSNLSLTGSAFSQSVGTSEMYAFTPDDCKALRDRIGR